MPVQNIVCVQCIEESAHFFLLRYIGRQHTSTTQNHWELYTAWQWILPAVSTSLPQCIWTATTQPASEKWIHLPLMSVLPTSANLLVCPCPPPPNAMAFFVCICNNLQQRVSMQFWHDSWLLWFQSNWPACSLIACMVRSSSRSLGSTSVGASQTGLLERCQVLVSQRDLL